MKRDRGGLTLVSGRYSFLGSKLVASTTRKQRLSCQEYRPPPHDFTLETDRSAEAIVSELRGRRVVLSGLLRTAHHLRLRTAWRKNDE